MALWLKQPRKSDRANLQQAAPSKPSWSREKVTIFQVSKMLKHLTSEMFEFSALSINTNGECFNFKTALTLKPVEPNPDKNEPKVWLFILTTFVSKKVNLMFKLPFKFDQIIPMALQSRLASKPEKVPTSTTPKPEKILTSLFPTTSATEITVSVTTTTTTGSLYTTKTITSLTATSTTQGIPEDHEIKVTVEYGQIYSNPVFIWKSIRSKFSFLKHNVQVGTWRNQLWEQ